MSMPRIIKSWHRMSTSTFLQERRARQPWTASEDSRLVQFVVECNKGKKHWNTGRKVLDKYFSHLQKAGQTQRTVSAMAFRLHVLRQAIRENLASDEYGIDLESRKKLAARTHKKQKRGRNWSGSERRARPRVKSGCSDWGRFLQVSLPSGGRQPWNQLGDDSDDEDDDEDSERSTSREVAPHPAKTGSQTRATDSKAVSSFSQRKIVVKFDASREQQSAGPAVLPRRLPLDCAVTAGPSRKAQEETMLELDTSHGHSMVQVEKSKANQEPSQSAALPASVSFMTQISAETSRPAFGTKNTGGIIASTIPGQGIARLEHKVMPMNHTKAGILSPGRMTALITLDDTPEVKTEASDGCSGDRLRAATPDDFAIVKQLAAVPGTTLNEAFTMYLKNKDLYRRLYLELSKK